MEQNQKTAGTGNLHRKYISRDQIRRRPVASDRAVLQFPVQNGQVGGIEDFTEETIEGTTIRKADFRETDTQETDTEEKLLERKAIEKNSKEKYSKEKYTIEDSYLKGYDIEECDLEGYDIEECDEDGYDSEETDIRELRVKEPGRNVKRKYLTSEQIEALGLRQGKQAGRSDRYQDGKKDVESKEDCAGHFKKPHAFLFFWLRLVMAVVMIGLILYNVIPKMREAKAERGFAIPVVEVITQEDIVEPIDEIAEEQSYIMEHFWTVRPQRLEREQSIAFLKSYATKYPEFNTILDREQYYSDRMLESLVNNPEMYEFMDNYRIDRVNDITEECSLTEAEIKQQWPLLIQWDSRWGYQEYGDSVIGLAGCGPTCVSMAVIGLTGDTTCTPDDIADLCRERGYYVENVGTSWKLITQGVLEFGLESKEIYMIEESMKAYLDQGKAIICSVRRGDFTARGHFILIYGYDEEGFFVNDPNSLLKSQKKWSFAELKPQVKNLWYISKP